MFAYSWPGRRAGSKVWNGLHYIVREPPFSTAKLIDDDYTIDFAGVTTPSDRVAVITTKPLTNEEGWTEFKRGELIMFDNGLPYATPEKCEFVEAQGRGLKSKCFRKHCPLVSKTMKNTTNTSHEVQIPATCPKDAAVTPASLHAAVQVATAAACLDSVSEQRQQQSTAVTESSALMPSRVC